MVNTIIHVSLVFTVGGVGGGGGCGVCVCVCVWGGVTE